MRLRQLFTGELTWRELGVLIRGLPPSSRLRAALGDGAPAWATADYLLADIYDALANANWQRGYDHRKPSKRPKPYPRPSSPARGKDSPEREAARQDAIRRARERQRAIDAGEIT